MHNENCIHSLSFKFIIYIYVFFANKIEFERRRRCKKHKYRKKSLVHFSYEGTLFLVLSFKSTPAYIQRNKHYCPSIGNKCISCTMHDCCISLWRLSCFQLNSTLVNGTYFAAVFSCIPSFCLCSSDSELRIDNNW